MGPFLDPDEKPIFCVLCEHDIAWSQHHLVPLPHRYYSLEPTRHTKIWLCRGCHPFLHKTFTNTQLAVVFNTLQALKQHPVIANYILKKKQIRIIDYSI